MHVSIKYRNGAFLLLEHKVNTGGIDKKIPSDQKK